MRSLELLYSTPLFSICVLYFKHNLVLASFIFLQNTKKKFYKKIDFKAYFKIAHLNVKHFFFACSLRGFMLFVV